MADGNLHDTMFMVKPEDAKPKQFLVGVLHLGKDPSSDLVAEDFQWANARKKTLVEKVLNAYEARTGESDVELWLNNRVVPPETMIKDLDEYNDSYIALQARKKLPHHPRIKGEPLEPADVNSLQPQFESQVLKQEDAFSHRDALRDVKCASLDAPTTKLPEPEHHSAGNGSNSPVFMPEPAPSHAGDHIHIPLHYPAIGNSGTEMNMQQRRLSHASPFEAVQAPLAQINAQRDLNTSPPERPEQGSIWNSNPYEMTQNIGSESQTSKLERSPVPEDSQAAEDSQAPESQQFDPEDTFQRDFTPEEDLTADANADEQHVDELIRDLISQENVDVLETTVTQSMKMLEKLRKNFAQYVDASPDASAWIESIEKLKKQSVRSRIVVGVVGNTGAGKSSVINAMLDEERLVPTNCMRACTAVVTELSWNASDDPGNKYRAEIEFIERVDWETELGNLMQEFLSENGNLVREASDQNSEAGIAWAKFHSVYPNIPRDDLRRWSVADLMADERVLNVLGTTQHIKRSRAEPFYFELQKYVDSKEKSTGKKSKDDKQPRNQFEMWPLIKVVKIYTKAAALSTGAVVVDLPGVHDSNAARAAVAERYMKQCSGLWIVAPINRAVDDKAAKNLLGDSFKRQLKYDGNYSAVTFICSKTDDISITEATDSLELHDEISELDAKVREYTEGIETAQEDIDKLRDTASVYKAVLDEVDDEIEDWEDLRDRVDTEEVYAPKSNPVGKRKRSSEKKPRKRQRNDFDSDVEYVESGSEDDGPESVSDEDDVETAPEPLTAQAIEGKLAELKTSKKSARQEKKKADDEIRDLRPMVRELRIKINEVNAQIKALCIDGRNKYSKGAIQQDFAAGIKELDQENAIEEDEANFNPDEDLRDYDAVASSLPVFCVSSRAYQKMCGRLKKDDDVPGFQTKEETEVPQLQDHCRKLTENGRIQTCRTFLLNLSQLFTTFSLWASNDGTGLELTDADKQKQVQYLASKFKELEKGLENAVALCLKTMKKELSEQIFNKYPELIEEAVRSAPATSSRWGDRSTGGVHYMTYKAVVRRGGAYHSPSAGPRDFNAELLEPITKKLATGWERAFQKRLPKAFEAYTKNAAAVLHAFHGKIEERARHNGVGLANLARLGGSIHTYEAMFQELNNQLLTRMTEAQRDANREFVPTIASLMMTVYNLCADESGTGSYMRMKGHMADFVQQHSHHMFPAATKTVEQHLNKMCRGLEEEMANKADEIFGLMRADYMRVLGGVQVSHEVMPKFERTMKQQVNGLLKEFDQQFERFVNGDFTGSEDEEQDGPAKGRDAPSEAHNQEDNVTENHSASEADDRAGEDAEMAEAPASHVGSRRRSSVELPQEEEDTPTI